MTPPHTPTTKEKTTRDVPVQTGREELEVQGQVVPREQYTNLQFDVLLVAPRDVLAQPHLRHEAERVLHEQYRGSLARRKDSYIEDAEIHALAHDEQHPGDDGYHLGHRDRLAEAPRRHPEDQLAEVGPLAAPRDVRADGGPVRSDQQLGQRDQAHAVEPSLEEVAPPQVVVVALRRPVLQELLRFLQPLLAIGHIVTRTRQDELRAADQIHAPPGRVAPLDIVRELLVMVGHKVIDERIPLRHRKRVRSLTRKRVDLQMLTQSARRKKTLLSKLQRAEGAAKRSAAKTHSILEVQKTCDLVLEVAREISEMARKLEDDLMTMDALQTEVVRLRKEQGAHQKGMLLYGVPPHSTTFWSGKHNGADHR